MDNIKPRILFILHLPPPMHGASAVGKYIENSNAINDAFEADYLNLGTSKQLNESGKGGFRKFYEICKLQVKLVNILARKNYKFCYVTLNSKGPSFYKDVLVVFTLKLFQKKIIYHFHNKGVAQFQHKKLDDLLYRFVFKNTKTILLSRYLYPDIKKYVQERDVYYCPNGVPVINEELLQIFDKRRNINKCRLLFLSNMMIDKGVYILLDACKILKDSRLDFECHFAGAWSDITKKDFHMATKIRGIESYIFSHGMKHDLEKYELLKGADIFIHPTFNDCFPLVLLEAIQFGLPVIASDEGGIPEIVIDNETGFLVPIGNAEILAEKIKYLMGNPDKSIEMGKKGKERFAQKFTLNIFEDQMLNILRQYH
jgi:glycosyltransferase involved in cell wall biosynthesis